MCVFVFGWATHHPQDMSFSNPQLNFKKYSQCVFIQYILVVSDMPNPNIDICVLHYFLSPLLQIHIRQTAVVKYKVSWSFILYD